MIDMTKCSGEGCPFQEDCARAFFNPFGQDQMQSHFAEVPYKDGKCDYFIQFTMKTQKVKK